MGGSEPRRTRAKSTKWALRASSRPLLTKINLEVATCCSSSPASVQSSMAWNAPQQITQVIVVKLRKIIIQIRHKPHSFLECHHLANNNSNKVIMLAVAFCLQMVARRRTRPRRCSSRTIRAWRPSAEISERSAGRRPATTCLRRRRRRRRQRRRGKTQRGVVGAMLLLQRPRRLYRCCKRLIHRWSLSLIRQPLWTIAWKWMIHWGSRTVW